MKRRTNLIEYLEDSFKRVPDKIAFADEGRSFTYRELLDYSKRAGSVIAKMTESCAAPVVVFVDRTAISLVGFLSALQAGCYYIPVDVKMPGERMNAILCEVEPAVILYAERDRKTADNYSDSFATLCMEEAFSAEIDQEILNRRRYSTLDIDPAYMIYTSGSTGKPKGIPVSHLSVIDFTEWMTENCDIVSDDILGNQAPFYFDLSVKDIYQTLKNGCTTYIIPKKMFMFPTLLIDFLNSCKVTGLIWATSGFRLVADSGIFSQKSIPTLRKVILGGEALQAKHLNIWKKANPKCTFINLYGPTEVTVDCTMYKIEKDFSDGEAIPIGKACRNMEILLLDGDRKKLVSKGEAGEICVRGSGLAIGYFKDKEKTESSFIQNPLNDRYPDRIYCTGDIAKTDDDGNLLFLCRRDAQVKHMGYRIELGEIETVLSGVQGINSAVCLFDEQEDRIICFTESKLDPSAIVSEIKDRLPRYMIPNEWFTCDSFPLNPNGKIDRVSLRERYFNELKK